MPLSDPQLAGHFWKHLVVGAAELDLGGRFLFANPAFCNMVGYSEAELQQRTWMSITHPDDLVGDEGSVRKLLNGEADDYMMAKRYITKMGNVIWVSLKVFAYRKEDKVSLFLAQVKPMAELTLPRMVGDREVKAALLKENMKWLIGAFTGVGLAVVGSFTKDTTLQTTGLTLIGGVFAGYTVSRGAK